MAFKGSDEHQTIKVAKERWIVVADDGHLRADGLADENGEAVTTRGGTLTVAPRSALILAQPAK